MRGTRELFFCAAVAQARFQDVKEMLDAGVDPGACDSSGRSAVAFADAMITEFERRKRICRENTNMTDTLEVAVTEQLVIPGFDRVKVEYEQVLVLLLQKLREQRGRRTEQFASARPGLIARSLPNDVVDHAIKPFLVPPLLDD